MNKRILFSLISGVALLGATNLKEIEKNIDDLNLANNKEFKTNLEKLVQKMPKGFVVENITKLKNSSSLIAIISDSNNNKLPIFINHDGTIINSISQIFISDDLLSEEISVFLKANMPLDNEVKAEQNLLNQSVKKITDKIPQEYSVKLKSDKKDAKFQAIVISDPECPYCRLHLKNELPKMLEEMDVDIYFAPVHEVPSYIKSQLILNDTKSAKSTKEKLDILHKYYGEEYVLNETEKKIAYDKIETYRNIILNETGISGVPSIHIFEKGK